LSGPPAGGPPPSGGRALYIMCAWCRRVRDPEGVWSPREDARLPSPSHTFTHGICPDCFRRETEAASSDT